MDPSFDTELRDDFLVEAGELVERLGEQLVGLEASPQDAELLNAVFRAFHTVKGGAGFLGVEPMVQLCHHAEDLLNEARNGAVLIDAGADGRAARGARPAQRHDGGAGGAGAAMEMPPRGVAAAADPRPQKQRRAGACAGPGGSIAAPPLPRRRHRRQRIRSLARFALRHAAPGTGRAPAAVPAGTADRRRRIRSAAGQPARHRRARRRSASRRHCRRAAGPRPIRRHRRRRIRGPAGQPAWQGRPPGQVRASAVLRRQRLLPSPTPAPPRTAPAPCHGRRAGRNQRARGHRRDSTDAWSTRPANCVLLRNRLLTLAARDGDDTLAATVDELDRVADDLQNAVLRHAHAAGRHACSSASRGSCAISRASSARKWNW